MNERTFQIALPVGLAEAFVASLEQILKAEGFQESLKAGEVGGIETSVWSCENAQVVIVFHESKAEKTISVSAQGIDGARIVKVAGVRLALSLLEGLPLEVKKTLEPALVQLRQHAT